MNRRLLLPVIVLYFTAALGLSACTAQTNTTPTSSATRKLRSEEIQQRAVAKCLNAAGWTVTYDALDNSIQSSIATSQQSKYDAAFEKCNAPYVKKQISLSDLSQAQWKDLYGQETKTASCLRRLGVDVPQIPAFQTYVDQYQSSSPWLSYNYIGTPDKATFEKYLTSCPPPYLAG